MHQNHHSRSMHQWINDSIQYWENYLVENPGCRTRGKIQSTIAELRTLV